MRRDAQDFIRLARSAGTLADLDTLLDSVTRSFGFTYFILGHHVRVLEGNAVHLSSYPSGFVEAMAERPRLFDDPVFRGCNAGPESFRWSELPDRIAFSRHDADVLSGAEREGIGEGFTVPSCIAGERMGSCSFAMRAGRTLDARVLPAVQFVGSLAFDVGRRLARRDLRPPGVPVLSTRELECVVLVARGKSDWDMGRILGLNKSTVHQYIENAKSKYGVASRVQLVIKALYDSQIGFDDIVRH